MKRKDMIRDLMTLKSFFEEQSGAYPVSLDFAIKEPSERQKRKKGEWIVDPKSKRIRCSNCLAFALMDDYKKECKSDYCSVCGAYMMGESE